MRTIGAKTRSIAVCETCVNVIGEITHEPVTAQVVMVEARKHPNHEIVTLDRLTCEGKTTYVCREGLRLKPNLLL